jgi:UDP-glucose 4-epimerase
VRAVVTGGAGFIGSNLVGALAARGDDVVVVDDLSTGYLENIPDDVRLVKASITDGDALADAVRGADVVFHLAAQRAVPRSLAHPLDTDLANTHGTLAVLQAARDAGVRRVVYASSSSVYGGAARLPTPETAPTFPRSPYGVSKLAGEHYCRVFAELYSTETVALRFFNVYGPRQRPDAAYAAVIPTFIEAISHDREVEVHGTGEQARDFAFVADAVAAMVAASTAPKAAGRVYNIACGRRISLLELVEELGRLLGVEPRRRHTAPRLGDIHMSHADISAATADLGYRPAVSFTDGLARTIEWFTGGATA